MANDEAFLHAYSALTTEGTNTDPTTDHTYSTPTKSCSSTNGKRYTKLDTVHRDLRLWICETCGVAFKTKAHLNRHRKIHTGIREHMCELCGKGFVLKQGLWIHQKTHKGDKPFKCSVCDNLYTTSASLTTHMKIHNNQRDHACGVCSRTFVQKKTYLEHLKLHESNSIQRKALFTIPTVFCSICGKGLANVVGLRRHLRKHELGQLKSFLKLNNRVASRRNVIDKGRSENVSTHRQTGPLNSSRVIDDIGDKTLDDVNDKTASVSETNKLPNVDYDLEDSFGKTPEISGDLDEDTEIGEIISENTTSDLVIEKDRKSIVGDNRTKGKENTLEITTEISKETVESRDEVGIEKDLEKLSVAISEPTNSEETLDIDKLKSAKHQVVIVDSKGGQAVEVYPEFGNGTNASSKQKVINSNKDKLEDITIIITKTLENNEIETCEIDNGRMENGKKGSSKMENAHMKEGKKVKVVSKKKEISHNDKTNDITGLNNNKQKMNLINEDPKMIVNIPNIEWKVHCNKDISNIPKDNSEIPTTASAIETIQIFIEEQDGNLNAEFEVKNEISADETIEVETEVNNLTSAYKETCTYERIEEASKVNNIARVNIGDTHTVKATGVETEVDNMTRTNRGTDEATRITEIETEVINIRKNKSRDTHTAKATKVIGVETEVNNKTKANNRDTHIIKASKITEIETEVNNKRKNESRDTHTVKATKITGVKQVNNTTKANIRVTHTVKATKVTGVKTEVNNMIKTDETSRRKTETEVNNKRKNKSRDTHTHKAAKLTGVETEVNNMIKTDRKTYETSRRITEIESEVNNMTEGNIRDTRTVKATKTTEVNNKRRSNSRDTPIVKATKTTEPETEVNNRRRVNSRDTPTVQATKRTEEETEFDNMARGNSANMQIVQATKRTEEETEFDNMARGNSANMQIVKATKITEIEAELNIDNMNEANTEGHKVKETNEVESEEASELIGAMEGLNAVEGLKSKDHVSENKDVMKADSVMKNEDAKSDVHIKHAAVHCNLENNFINPTDKNERENKNKGDVCGNCGKCTYCLNQIGSVQLQKDNHKEVENYGCKTCGVAFSSKHKFTSHIREKHDQFPFKCRLCPKAFATLSGYRKHEILHKGGNEGITLVREHMCPECGKLYSTSNSLKNHLVTHAADKPYKCETCYLSFSQKGHLIRHIRVLHRHERAFPCTVNGCQKAFTDNFKLRTHLKTHSGEKSYRCKDCGRYFSTSSVLKTHVKTQHLKVRGFTCSICFQDFTAKHSLQTHMQRHHNLDKMDPRSVNFVPGYRSKVKQVKQMQPKLFKCDQCDRGFTTKRGMWAHVRKRCMKKGAK